MTAEQHASAADRRAHVLTRAAAADELGAAVALFETTWGVGRSPDRALLLAATSAGCPVVLAVDGTEPVGAAFAFGGTEGGLHWHSHMAAVAPAYRGHGAGVALKLRQRALALAAGVPEIRWTFDPLIRRNANLNLVRLGAQAERFLPDFYGSLGDAVNGDDATDRLEVSWRLDSQRVSSALRGGTRELRAWSGEARLRLPPDFERMRSTDPGAARALREESGSALQAAFAAGLRPEVAGDGYVFTEDPA